MKTEVKNKQLCRHCGKGTFSARTLPFHAWKDNYLGELALTDFLIYECSSCHRQLIPYESVLRIERAEALKLETWLFKQAGNALEFDAKFLSNAELVSLLGVSRQAINKSPKYRNLIYCLCIKGEYFYYRESAKLFKKHGDGRLHIDEVFESQVDSTIKDLQKGKIQYHTSSNGVITYAES